VALNDRQKLFVDEYIKLGNAYQAALNAGYKKSSAKDASKWINPELLKNPNENERKKYKPELREAIDQRLAEKEAALIADQNEILKYLTQVLRGQSQSEVVVVVSTGDFSSKAEKVQKAPDEKERLKAAELLGKRYGLYTEKVSQNIDMDLNISIDYGDDDETDSENEGGEA
jgi:phage terminase small subunit